MNKKSLTMALLCTAAAFLSCSEDNSLFRQEEYVQHVCVTGCDFEGIEALVEASCKAQADADAPAQTRTAYTVDASKGFLFSWTEGDTIGIYPVGADQVSFPISEGEGTKYASFNGGAWALRSSYTYGCYYPFSSANYHVKETKLPVDYTGQTQRGNNSLAHLGRYDYMAASAAKPDAAGELAITMHHLGCFVMVKLTIPSADSFSKLVLESNGTQFTTSGTFDLSAATPAIVPTKTASSVQLSLEGVSTITANESLLLYLCMAPVNLSGSTIKATLYGNVVKTYTAEFTGKDMVAGKAYLLQTESTETTSYDGHEYVDLGLPSGNLWATMDMGATTPEGTGSRYAWGETKTKSSYSWSTYDGYKAAWTETGGVDADGFPIEGDTYHPAEYPDYGIDICGSQYDAATSNWGGYWHMPTDVDWQELLDNCTWTSTTKNGVSGYKVTASNGNWIFIASRDHWSSTIDGGSESSAKYAFGVSISANSRCLGNYIRPVYNKNATKVAMSTGHLEIAIGETAQLTATACPSNAVSKSITWTSTNNSIARVSADGLVTAVSEGTATVEASIAGQLKVSCEIQVCEKLNGHYYVDLGLSVKWATCNVGASSPEGYGDYFAWGETEPYYESGYAQSDNPVWKSGKSGGYSWSSYKYCNGSYNTLTKYCNNSSYGYNGYTDSKTVLDAVDDAATANWGGTWRMPTKAEQDELSIDESCTWTWYDSGNAEYNGIAGHKVTSKKSGYTDRSIFLPASGYRWNTRLGVVGSGGYYWSSSLSTDNPCYACDLNFGSGDFYWSNFSRNYGHSVRPVCQ